MKLTRSLSAAATAVALSAFALTPGFAQESTTPAAPAGETTAPANQQAQASTQSTSEMPQGNVLPDIVLGQENAPVTMIEYASFTCSHCRDFHNENFKKLQAEYIDTGKVKFVQRDIYFDAVGLWAGVLARCGGDAKYYPMADLLFSQQQTWLAGKTGDEIAANLRKIGAQAGMTTEQMDACWADKQKVADLVATFQKNAGGDQIEGTPTFMIGGEKVMNQPWEDMKKVIDAKIAAAG